MTDRCGASPLQHVIEVVFVDRTLLEGAIGKMERYRDKALSLPDCASLALMDHLGLDTAFAFDSDFRDCGYQMLPRVNP